MALAVIAGEHPVTGTRQTEERRHKTTPLSSESTAAGLSETDAVRIRSLIVELGSKSFQVRQDAERELRQFDEKLLEYLKATEPPASVEIQSRLRRLVRKIEIWEMTEGSWTLTTQAMPGENATSKTKTLRFLEDGTFLHTGPSGEGVERWEVDREARTFQLSYNDNYAVYKGTFTEAGDIVGKAINRDGREWQFHMTPKVMSGDSDGLQSAAEDDAKEKPAGK